MTDQVDGWRRRSRRRRQERQANLPFDTREVLYGKVIEFIVDECFAAPGGTTDADRRWTPPADWQWRELAERAAEGRPVYVSDAVAEIHARWLMTPRDDLRGQTPRDLLHARRSDLSLHMQDREIQWSNFGECPPPLWRQSIAYRCGGYGTHEIVIYYYLLRHLIHECWDMVVQPLGQTLLTTAEAIDRLGAANQDWLHTPNHEDYSGKTPAQVIECERLRIPMGVSGADAMVDHDCPLCQSMADMGPMFWHLDGCNMDDEFPFALFHTTREEWEKEQQEWAEFDAKCERERRAREAAGQDEDLPWPDEDVGESPPIWQRSFGNSRSGDSPEVILFGLGAHLAELVVDLRTSDGSQNWIDSLNRDYGNLREAAADPSSSLVGPVVATFSEHLTDVAGFRPDLNAKCSDLERQINDFARRLSGEPVMDDDIPF